MRSSGSGRYRVVYLAAAAVTIGLGLTWHLSPAIAGADVKDVVGDALWAAMMFWVVSSVLPMRSLRVRAGLAIAVCYAVEISQLYHAPFIDSIRATLLGHLVLGSGFDPRDLVAYAAGVVVGVLLDRVVRRVAR